MQCLPYSCYHTVYDLFLTFINSVLQIYDTWDFYSIWNQYLCFLLFNSTLHYSIFFIFILTTLNVCWCAIRKMLTQYSPTDFTCFILSECFGSILVFPSFSLSSLTDIFPGEPGLAGCIEAKDDGIGGANWNYKSYKAPLRWLPPTNQHLTVLLSLFCCI